MTRDFFGLARVFVDEALGLGGQVRELANAVDHFRWIALSLREQGDERFSPLDLELGWLSRFQPDFDANRLGGFFL